MTVTTSDADWAAMTAEREQHIAEIHELRKLRDAHDAQWKSLSLQAEAGARDAALWRSQFEDAQRMLDQLRRELGRERGLRVNAVAALKAMAVACPSGSDLYLLQCAPSPTLAQLESLSSMRERADAALDNARAVISEAERHG